jgi:hypothetical protein
MKEKDPSESIRESKPEPLALVPSDRASPYPVSRLAPAFDLVDIAREIQEADKLLGVVVSGQLDVIADQIRGLQAKARELLQRAEMNAQLHRAACNLKKRPGHIYHLYRRSEQESYFSLLSPEEWGGAPPHPHEGAYRLELDMSFTRVEA